MVAHEPPLRKPNRVRYNITVGVEVVNNVFTLNTLIYYFNPKLALLCLFKQYLNSTKFFSKSIRLHDAKVWNCYVVELHFDKTSNLQLK